MDNYSKMMTNLRDLVENPTPRVPVALCLDVSGSMIGAPIQELQAGVDAYFQEMRDDDMTRSSVETAVVTFSENARCELDFCPVDKAQVPRFTTDSITDMGSGLRLALEKLEERKRMYGTGGVPYYQPILVVMTDGYPNGEKHLLDEMTDQIHTMAERRKITVLAIGIGSDADMETLRRLSPRGKALRLDGLRFREFFAWFSSSVAQVSASTPGDEPEMDMDDLMDLAEESWPEESL